MRTTIRTAAVAFLALSVAVSGAGLAHAQTARQAVDVYPNVPVTGTPATFTFEGRVHNPAVTVELPAAGAVSLSAAETRVVEYLRALAQGDEAAVVASWAPRERDAAAAKLAGNLPQIREAFSGLRTVRLHGEIAYGPYVLVLAGVRMDGQVLLRRYPLRREADGLYLTDELADDRFFSELSRGLLEALADGRGRLSERPVTAEPAEGLRVSPGEIRYGMAPAEGVAGDALVELILRGEVYPGGELLVGPGAPVPASGTDPESDLASLRRAFSAWRDGTYGDVLALWAPDQQGAFARFYSPESFPTQRAIYRKPGGVRLLARVDYGVLEIPLIEVPGTPARMTGDAFGVRAAEPERPWTFELLPDPIFNLLRVSLADELAQEIGAAAANRDETEETDEMAAQTADENEEPQS